MLSPVLLCISTSSVGKLGISGFLTLSSAGQCYVLAFRMAMPTILCLKFSVPLFPEIITFAPYVDGAIFKKPFILDIELRRP